MSKPIQFKSKFALGVPKGVAPLSKDAKKPLSVFGGGSDESDSDNDPPKPAMANKMGSGLKKLGSSVSSNIGLVALKSGATVDNSTVCNPESPVYDASVYAYDEVYDTMKQAEMDQLAQRRKLKQQSEGKALHMDNLLEAKRRRDQDRERALDVLKKKQREAEGDKYAGVESFVTSGYKEQQAALEKERKEEEIKERAQEEKKTKSGGDLAFYKSMMDTSEDIHTAMVKATQNKSLEPTVTSTEKSSTEETVTERAQAINQALGYTKVIVNDSGEVVDDGQLLSAGLNIQKKASVEDKKSRYGLDSRAITATSKTIPTRSNKPYQNRSRESQSRQIEDQISRQIAEQEDKKRRVTEAIREELVSSLKSRKSEDAVASARERYLARKRQKQE